MKTSIIAITATLLLATPAWADEAADNANSDNRDIIVTGTKLSGDFGAKSGIPIAKVPQSIQIVTAAEIVEQVPDQSAIFFATCQVPTPAIRASVPISRSV